MPPELEADFIIEPPEGFDCVFEINANTVTWGNIEGDIEEQTDLKNALDSKADDTEIIEIDGRLDTIEGTLSGYGNIVTHDTDEFATAAQGALADSAVQPSELNNYVPNTRTINNKALSSDITLNYSDVGALASTTTINDLTTTAQQNALNSGITSTDVTLIGTALQPNDDISKLNNDAGYIKGITSTDVTNALGYTPYNSTNPNGYIAGITSTDVTDALGYTPYNSTNPNGYSSTLNGLTDVSLTSPTQGQNLTYDAVNQKWINSSTSATVGWGGITGTLSDQTDLQNALNDKQNVIDANNKLSASYISGLSTVATSGSYNDLSNKPTIPTDVSDLTNSTLANVFLSNLNTTGEGRLYALKGYNDNGQILTDSILYNYIKSCYDNGTITSTDTYYTNDYTVVGSPTITDGVASGFSYSDGNYVTTSPFLQNLGDYDTWSIEIPITIGNSVTNRYDVVFTNLDSENNQKFMCQLYPGGKLRWYARNQNDTNIAYNAQSQDTFAINSSLILKIEFTGTQYIMSTKLSGGNWKVQNTINDSNKLFKTNTPFVIGCNPLVSADSNNWKGNINLWGIKFIGNNKLIYTPKLSVNYILGSNGCKIANADNRLSAIYVGDKYGYSPYFTIDTTNQNTTLPMPDLYSIIYRNTLANSFTSIQGYDGTATQTLKHVNGVLQWVSD